MTKERGGSLIFLAAGIYGLIYSIPLPLGKWNEPGPGVFPLALSLLLLVSGAAWFIQGRTKGEGHSSDGWQASSRKFLTAIQIVGLTALFIAALSPLGYVLTATIYLFVLYAWVSRYKLWLSALLSVLFGVGSWLFFDKLLSTPLPQGLWPF